MKVVLGLFLSNMEDYGNLNDVLATLEAVELTDEQQPSWRAWSVEVEITVICLTAILQIIVTQVTVAIVCQVVPEKYFRRIEVLDIAY